MNFTLLIQTIEEKLDLSSFTKEARELIIVELAENILERINLLIAATLNKEEAVIITELINTNEIESTLKFLSEKHPELDTQILKIADDVIRDFKEA